MLTMEAVCYIMKGKKLPWSDIKKVMGKSDFIDTVLNFDIDKVEKSVQENVIKNYLENKEWEIEKIYKSS